MDICDWPNILPISGPFYVHLASACVQCQKYDEADMSINVALGFQPRSRQALHIRGMLRELKGDFLGAMRDYQRWASWMDLTCAEAQQLLEACNKQERFAYLGGLGINAALLYKEDTKIRQQLLTRRRAELHAAKQCAAGLEGTIGLSKQWELAQSLQLLQSIRHISNCAGNYTRCIYNAALTELDPLLADYAAQVTASEQHVAAYLLVAAKSGAKLATSFPLVSSLVSVVNKLMDSILDSSKSDKFLETTERLNVVEAVCEWQGRANSACSTIIELPQVTVHRIYAKVIAMKHLPYTDAEWTLMSLLDRRGKEAVSRHNGGTAAFSVEVLLHNLMTATRQAAPKHDSIPDWPTFSEGLLTDNSKHRAYAVAFLTSLGIADLDNKLGPGETPVVAAHLVQQLGQAAQAYAEAAGMLLPQQHSEPPPCTGVASSQTAARSSSNFPEPQVTLSDWSQSAQRSHAAALPLSDSCSPDVSADRTRKAAKDNPISDALKLNEMAGTVTSTAINAGSNNLSVVESSASVLTESSIGMPMLAAGAAFQCERASGNSKLRPSAPPQHSRLHRLISRQAGPFDPVNVALLRPVN
ncbi:TPA: hypothetical protein ACH3X1_004634 [Trebouxia sp. C0004]